METELFPKYLIIDNAFAVCFSPAIGHDTVDVHRQNVITGKITGAGRFKIVDGRVCVFDYSHKLVITAKPSDADIIEQSLRLGSYAK